jgi:hypothetical protein
MTTAKYFISERDYLDSQNLYAKLTSKARTGFILALMLFLGAIFFASSQMRSTLIYGLMVGVVVAAVIRFVVAPIQGRRQYDKYKAIKEEFEIELVEDGLKLSSANGNTIARWDQTVKWRENEEFILIYPMSRVYYTVPKRVVAQGFDIELLRQKLVTKVGVSC